MAETAAVQSARHAAFSDLDFELSSTRRILERVPEDKWTWKPHDKSMSLARKATHLVEVLAVAESVVRSDFFDLARGHMAEPATRAELLELYDAQAERLRAGVDAV